MSLQCVLIYIRTKNFFFSVLLCSLRTLASEIAITVSLKVVLHYRLGKVGVHSFLVKCAVCDSSKARHIKTGSCVTHVKEPSVPSSIFHVLPEDIWHDTSAHHWQEWLTFQPIMVESFLPSVVSSGLSITMSALVLVYWSGRAALWVAVSSPMSLSDFFFSFPFLFTSWWLADRARLLLWLHACGFGQDLSG